MTISFREVAAVDLGSNSFHMVVARTTPDGGLEIVDKIRERVALGAGLDSAKRITPLAWERALACLSRFGERLEGLPRGAVRAVGTNTLRRARDSQEFLREAAEALGHGIEVVPGAEEARIIYLGVARSFEGDDARRLVVDIGGGSTELIVGEGLDALDRDSVQMGCVSFQQKFFADGRISEGRLGQAILAARLQLRGMKRRYRDAGWTVAVGASGTVKAVAAILRENRWAEHGITAAGLQQLREAVVGFEDVDQLALPGLERDRAPVLPSGLAVLSAVFEELQIEQMEVSPGAMREGLLWDLVGRIGDEDVRDATVGAFQQRWSVDVDHAARVEATACGLFRDGAAAWELDPQEGERMLRWAARLHEIGLAVAHGGYHRHSAYLVQNATMPGFSRDDQGMLAAVVLGHRRRVTRERLQQLLGAGQARVALRLAVFLRLACRLHRSRSRRALPTLSVAVSGRSIRLHIPEEYLAEHPLTLADLRDERVVLQAAGFDLDVI